MKSKVTVTIGIPAYNEAFNIGKLLRSLLQQKHRNFIIKRIIVVDDKSTDTTSQQVQHVRSHSVSLITNLKRMGQIYCQNLIFETAQTDIVVLLEADTLPINNQFLEHLVAPLQKHTAGGFVQGNIHTGKSKSIIGKILTAQKDIYHQFTLQDSRTLRWFSSGRGGRAFSASVYKKLRWPSDVPEDDFALLWCREHHISTYVQKNATCWYTSPQSLGDYISQIRKNNAARQALQQYFPLPTIKNIYDRPRTQRVSMLFFFLKTYPIYFFAFLFIQLAAFFQLKKQAFSDIWIATPSTKKIQTTYEHTTH